MATNFPASLDSLTNPQASDTLANPSHADQHANANDAIEALQAKVGVNGSAVTTSLDYKVAQAATLTGTQTLTNKTLQTPKLIGPIESWRLGSINTFSTSPPMDISISSAYLAQVTATSNVTINVRWSSSVSLDSYLASGNSVTVAYAHTNGATAYMPTTFQIDGVTQTPIWQGGNAPASGNANSTDVYVYTIIKTGTSTFRVFASQTKFA